MQFISYEKVQKMNTPDIIANESTTYNHLHRLTKYLGTCERFVCVTAFAKMSGFKAIEKSFQSTLSDGGEVIFIFGLDFFHTDPSLIKHIWELSKSNGKIKLYLSNLENKFVFHPKIFAFQNSSETKYMVGSANLTLSGLLKNTELSILDNFQGQMDKFWLITQIKEWISNRIITPATSTIISKYNRLYKKRKELERQTEKGFRKETKRKNSKKVKSKFESLKEYLISIKADLSDDGFEAQKLSRELDLMQSNAILQQIARIDIVTIKQNIFLDHYNNLLRFWHSGGLHRNKTAISKQPKKFVKALAPYGLLAECDPKKAFETLIEKFVKIEGAGTNVISEILHSANPSKFAVMNANSVHSVSKIFPKQFPKEPNKANVTGELYELFCDKVKIIMDELNLSTFSEADLLFNYVYWLEK